MTAADIGPEEYASYYQDYIQQSGTSELIESLEATGDDLARFMANIPEERLNYQYANAKWTLAEVLVHMIDAERIFAYRALRFGRNDKTPLQGFEENDYVPESRANSRSLDEIIAEFRSVRAATVSLFASFNDTELLRLGSANDNNMSVRAIGFVMIGHAAHHCKVIEQRYLI